MGRLAGATSRVYVDEFDFSGRTNAVEFGIDVNTPEDTTFADAAQSFLEGKYGSTLTLNGFFDPEAANYDAEMFGDIADGNEHCVGVYPGSAAPYSAKGYELIAKVKGQARPIEVAGAVLLNVNWTASGAVVRSTVLCNGAVTGTGAVANSAQNIGATGAGTVVVGILRVLAVSGTGSITVKIEQSSDNGSGDPYAELIAFAAKTAVGFERKTVATATEAWKRVNVTAFSGFTSVTILVIIGYEQGSYVAP